MDWSDERPRAAGWYHHRRDGDSPIRLVWFDGHDSIRRPDSGLVEDVGTVGQWSERLVVTEEPLPGMADQDEEGS